MSGSESTLDLIIRPVSVDDAAAVTEIRLQPSVLAGTLSLPSARVESSRSFIQAFGPDDHALVAELEGRVVGMAGMHVKSGKQRHAASVGMMVHEQFQNRGVGRKLLAALLEIADDYLGLIRVELEVLVENDRAIHLYESLGFTTEGRKVKAHRRADGYADAFIMARLRDPR